jgi:putative nucleotidyltransferase with HDIG domain
MCSITGGALASPVLYQAKVNITMDLVTQSQAILAEWVTSDMLRKHCGAVAASMAHLATHYNGDADVWEATGWLHDMDYERHPDLTATENAHPYVGVRWLREHGWSEEICRAILSHADYTGVSRDSVMEKSLAAVDELSSFVVAVALVRPSKNIADVDVAAVKKKFKDKGFARAVNREEISHNADALGLPLDDLITMVIAALSKRAASLGIAGVPA